MADNKPYSKAGSELNALGWSKRSFAGNSERDELLTALEKSLNSDSIRWLEVGVGDGTNLAFIANQLSKTRKLSLTTIDPHTKNDDLRFDPDLSWRHLQCRVEDFTSSEKFDCINIRHSAYYFNNPAKELARLSGLLDHGSILAITLWTTGCILYQVHLALAQRLGIVESALTIDDARMSLQESGLTIESFCICDLAIDRQLIISDLDVTLAIAHLAARNLPVQLLPEDDVLSIVRVCLDECGERCIRQNAIIVLRK